MFQIQMNLILDPSTTFSLIGSESSWTTAYFSLCNCSASYLLTYRYLTVPEEQRKNGGNSSAEGNPTRPQRLGDPDHHQPQVSRHDPLLIQV